MKAGFADAAWRQEYRRRTVLLYRRSGAKTLAAQLAPLSSQLQGKVEVDINGTPYLEGWRQAKTTPDYELLGQRPQPGRDYAENPPKSKTSKRLVFAAFPKGLETLLRIED